MHIRCGYENMHCEKIAAAKGDSVAETELYAKLKFSPTPKSPCFRSAAHVGRMDFGVGVMVNPAELLSFERMDHRSQCPGSLM